MWLSLPAATVLVAPVVLVTFLRSEAGRERRRGMVVVMAVATLMAVEGVMLVGITGAIVYELCVPWARLMLGSRFIAQNDAPWATARLVTLAWPWSLGVALALWAQRGAGEA